MQVSKTFIVLAKAKAPTLFEIRASSAFSFFLFSSSIWDEEEAAVFPSAVTSCLTPLPIFAPETFVGLTADIVGIKDSVDLRFIAAPCSVVRVWTSVSFVDWLNCTPTSTNPFATS